ncbi:MAG: DUF4123 domain-containing protein [Phycisphaerae bacterium]|nr:DUF4123 domain-containing protein [Phycisphaerae bacterium]
MSLLTQYPMKVDDLFEVAEHLGMYAILDAADAPAVSEMIQRPNVEAASLYDGQDLPPVLGLAAPHLVRGDEDLLSWVRNELWDDPWGIFIESGIELSLLRRHLRRFLLVRDDVGRDVCLRFYDPRVLSRFLPVCNDEELTNFFGPVQAFIARGDSPDEFTRYALLPLSERDKRSAAAGRGRQKPAVSQKARTRSFMQMREEHMVALADSGQDQAADAEGKETDDKELTADS